MRQLNHNTTNPNPNTITLKTLRSYIESLVKTGTKYAIFYNPTSQHALSSIWVYLLMDFPNDTTLSFDRGVFTLNPKNESIITSDTETLTDPLVYFNLDALSLKDRDTVLTILASQERGAKLSKPLLDLLTIPSQAVLNGNIRLVPFLAQQYASPNQLLTALNNQT